MTSIYDQFENHPLFNDDMLSRHDSISKSASNGVVVTVSYHHARNSISTALITTNAPKSEQYSFPGETAFFQEELQVLIQIFDELERRFPNLRRKPKDQSNHSNQ